MEIELLGMKLRVEVIIAIIILYFVIWGNILCSCAGNTSENITQTKKVVETFTNLGGKDVTFSLGDGASSVKARAPNTKKWFTPNLTYVQGTAPDTGVSAILDRPQQPVPLPEGQMDFFATTKFKPECCPNAYSTGSGCACMTVPQYNNLRERGGNNVPYREL